MDCAGLAGGVLKKFQWFQVVERQWDGGSGWPVVG